MNERPKKTLVVNFFAGASAGKTTCAWELSSVLKKNNIVVEYVPEYAKELVWDGHAELLNGSLDNQMNIFNEQKRRIDRLIGKVDVIVTDSPLLLQVAYIKEQSHFFENIAVDVHEKYNNLNLFVKRGNYFEKEGRIHDLEESRKIDNDVINILSRNGFLFANYTSDNLNNIVAFIKLKLNELQCNVENESSISDNFLKM